MPEESTSAESWHDDAAKMARILQIIVAAMCAGVAAFLAVTLVVVSHANEATPLLPVSLTAIVAVFVGIGLVARLVAVSFLTTKARRAIAAGMYQKYMPNSRPNPPMPAAFDSRCSNEQCFLSVFQIRTIIGAALFEGLAFFATIAYMLEGSPICLGLSAFLLFGVSLHFPTKSRIIHWVEGQLDATEQENETTPSDRTKDRVADFTKRGRDRESTDEPNRR